MTGAERRARQPSTAVGQVVAATIAAGATPASVAGATSMPAPPAPAPASVPVTTATAA